MTIKGLITRENFALAIKNLDIDTMYINRHKSLQASLDFITYQGKEEVITLINSGATENFINFRTVTKL
jgi:hypothetical protein